MSDPNNPYQAPPEAPGGVGAYGPGMPPAQYQHQYGAPPSPVGPAPRPVVTAARLMFVSAALSLIQLIVLFAAKSSLRNAIEKKNPGFDTHQIDTAVNAAIGVGVAFGIIFVVLYLLLALQVQKGKNWARIVAWVITGLGVLSALASLAQPIAAASRLFTLIGGAIDLAVIILLAQKVSNDYFRRRPVQ